MRKSNGFTLIEILAVIIILALLIVLVVPSYTAIYSNIKRQNYHSKIVEINAAAQKYGSTIKDDVKDSLTNSCITIEIADLIEKGYLISEEDSKPVIHDPTTNKAMEGSIDICYCRSSFDIQSFYAEDFTPGVIYHEDDYVRFDGKTYKCLMTTSRPNMSPAGIDAKDDRGRRYFEELKC